MSGRISERPYLRTSGRPQAAPRSTSWRRPTGLTPKSFQNDLENYQMLKKAPALGVGTKCSKHARQILLGQTDRWKEVWNMFKQDSKDTPWSICGAISGRLPPKSANAGRLWLGLAQLEPSSANVGPHSPISAQTRPDIGHFLLNMAAGGRKLPQGLLVPRSSIHQTCSQLLSDGPERNPVSIFRVFCMTPGLRCGSFSSALVAHCSEC